MDDSKAAALSGLIQTGLDPVGLDVEGADARAKTSKPYFHPRTVMKGVGKGNGKHSKTLTIEWVKAYAISKGGECLSDEYENYYQKNLSMKCGQGHGWSTSAELLRKGGWCSACFFESRRGGTFDLKWFVDYACSKGGECFSTQEGKVAAADRLSMRCSRGHVWSTTASNCRHGASWCNICHHMDREKGKVGLQWFIDFAASKSGKCLSEEYVDQRAPMRFECSEGHQWKTTAGVVKQGGWCAKCVTKGQRLGLAWFHEHARSKGGKCHATEYKSMHVPMPFECGVGHRWNMKGNFVKNAGTWCPECRAAELPGLGWFKAHALAKGGLCLSIEYRHSAEKLEFECAEGHRWSTAASNVRSAGSWCPACATKSLTENKVRSTLESLTGLPLPKAKPAWLRSPKNWWMELDGYNETSLIAFEYQGIQHAKFTPAFHKTMDCFVEQKKRDEQKARQVAERGILLLVIDQISNRTEKRIVAAVEGACQKACLPIAANPEYREFLSELRFGKACLDLLKSLKGKL